MNMQAMGGPVGGIATGAQMNAGSPSGQSVDMTPQNMVKKLNTAIYDYLLRSAQYEIAKSFIEAMPCESRAVTKEEQKQANGIDDSLDEKRDHNILRRPDGLPLPLNYHDGPVLQDWWCQFWEIWLGQRGRSSKNGTNSYISNQRLLQKGRNAMMVDPAMQNFRPGYNMMPGMNNAMAMAQGDLRKSAMAGNNQQRNLTPQQQAHIQQQNLKMQNAHNAQMMQGNAMERQGSQMDGNGQRSGSPGSGDGPSSPKRPRIEGNMQPMQQGRPAQAGQMQGTPVGPLSHLPQPDPAAFEKTLALLREQGIDPNGIPRQQLNKLSMQPADKQVQSLMIYANSLRTSAQAGAMDNNVNDHSNVSKGMNPNMGPGGAQGSPMNQAGLDGANPEFYAGVNGTRMPMPQNAAAVAASQATGNGNHALQDYQMQLMLLEQQNKKRLLMARQEQDMVGHPANGQFPPGMSPQGSQRGGDPSPNPNEMRGMIDPSQIPPGMRAQMMSQNGMMRAPPSSHPMAANMPNQQQHLDNMRAQGVALANGQFAGQQPGQAQMMQQGAPAGQPGQQQPMGTPRQANNMPPPPAPANASGTQPSSPSSQQPPPTPNQTTKAKPGNKKEPANKKGGSNKKGANNATPATEAEQPPTPTPATPATPMNANSFAHKQNQQLPNGQPAGANQANTTPNMAQNAQQQHQNAAAQQAAAAQAAVQQQQAVQAAAAAQQAQQQAQQQQQVPPGGNLGFDSMLSDDQFQNLDLGFTLGEGTDLDNFDFDSFLNNDGGEFAFDVNAAFDGETIA